MEELEQLCCKKEPFAKTPIELKLSPIHRYGVFATKDFFPKDIIEECPVIIFSHLTTDYRKEISDRQFSWSEAEAAIALGYGSMYNHADEPNAKYIQDHDDQVIRFTAITYIPAGTEIFINYGKDWFPSRKTIALSTEQRQRKTDIRLIKIVILLLFLLLLSCIIPTDLFTNIK